MPLTRLPNLCHLLAVDHGPARFLAGPIIPTLLRLALPTIVVLVVKPWRDRNLFR